MNNPRLTLEERMIQARRLAAELEQLLGGSLVNFLYKPKNIDLLLGNEGQDIYDQLKEDIEKLGFIVSFHLSVAPIVSTDDVSKVTIH